MVSLLNRCDNSADLVNLLNQGRQEDIRSQAMNIDIQDFFTDLANKSKESRQARNQPIFPGEDEEIVRQKLREGTIPTAERIQGLRNRLALKYLGVSHQFYTSGDHRF